MAENRVKRRLAAILAADIVGYSRLMEWDEAATLAALKARRQDLLIPLVQRYGGRAFKFTGDGVLVEFPSAVNAVGCAIDLQKGMAAANAGLPEENHIVLRVGVNLGDVLVEDGDLYGEGVNVAARLEAIAEPGGICVAAVVRDQVRGKVAAGFQDIGERQLKNIAAPVRAYAVRTEGDSATREAGSASTLKLPDKPSIAVLPFQNMSGDPEQDYFSDGITEDLITELSHFRDLFVISRNSSFAFKGTIGSVTQAAQKLGVQFVVEGSIRKGNDRVRITAQLIDATKDLHIWADRYDRNLQDIFALQDEIVQTVAATMVGRLRHAAHERVKRQSASNLRVYDLYLRGLEHFFTWTPDDNRRARELFRAAIDLEPDYAAAHAALSETICRDWLGGWSRASEEDFVSFLEIAAKSVQLDDEDSRTHTAFGFACIYHGEYEKARRHLDRAIHLNPSDARALAYLSRLELFVGRPALAIERVRAASRLNPYGKYDWFLGQAYYVAQNYGAALDTLRGISDPTAMVLAWLAASEAMAGKDREAKAASDAFTAAVEADVNLRAIASSAARRMFFAQRWPFQDKADLGRVFDGLHKAGLLE